MKGKKIGSNKFRIIFLHLPKQIVQNSVTTNYVYRADGIKVKKIYGAVETNYLEGFQYKYTEPWEDPTATMTNAAMKLRFVPTSEGYFDAMKKQYYYNFLDHLGNIRLSYSDADGNGVVTGDIVVNNCRDTPDGQVCNNYIIPGEAEGVNNYYPFGLLHNNQYNNFENAYQYKYNGKELQETGMYDYGARMLMPDIGRWGVVDPLAEKAPGWTPYRYGFNNPIKYTDPKGLFETKFGAWWHRMWNGGGQGSDIKYNAKRQEYYYNRLNESKGNEVNFSAVYGKNASKESGYPVLKIQAKADLGVGIGGKIGAVQGKAAILNQDIGYLQYDVIANKGTAKWGDGKVHNGLEVTAGLGKKSPISAGFGIDYNYDYNRVKDDGLSGVKGTEKLDWSLKAGLDVGSGVGNVFEPLNIQPSVSSGGVIDTGSDCYCIDLGVGVKALLGAEAKILIGIQK